MPVVLLLLIIAILAVVLIIVIPKLRRQQEQDAISPRAPLEKTWKPTFGGIWAMVSAAVILSFIGTMVVFLEGFGGAYSGGNYPTTTFLLLFGILIVALFVLLSGVFALKRKKWGWALAGSIVASFLYGLGIPAVILIAMSKKEFE